MYLLELGLLRLNDVYFASEFRTKLDKARQDKKRKEKKRQDKTPVTHDTAYFEEISRCLRLEIHEAIMPVQL